MPELFVYFARAMDARYPKDIIKDDENYTKLLKAIGGTIINPYKQGNQNPIEDGLTVSQFDLELLIKSDIVLADLSIPGYQYVGCFFEIGRAEIHDIPVILVEGERDFHNRHYIQAYCEYIAKTPGDAVEYIRRVHTIEGINEQMNEMYDYYDKIADSYKDNHGKIDAQNNTGYGQERKNLRMIIKERVKGKALQIGIGTGDWTKTICEKADWVVGIDQSKNMIDQARENLSSYGNIDFIHGDIFKNEINNGPFDCIVIYFLLSLLPSYMQQRLLNLVTKILKPGGFLIVADTRKMRDIPSKGLGRYRLQQRTSGNQVFTLYKEHFFGDSLVKLLEKNGFKKIDPDKKSVWFSWAVSCTSK
jgi:ubiquinone/menaquinone biosynthesis C-methylase UbiE